MKNKALYGLTLLVSLCLLLFACRKDINNFINDRESAPSMVVESAKIWRLEHLSVVPKNVKVLKPKWKDAWELSANGEQFLIVPAPEKVVQNKSIKIRRLFVFTLNGSKVVSGEIVEFLGQNYDVAKNLDFLLKNLTKDKIDGFSGSILRYNISYSAVVSSKTFSKGVRTGDFVLVKTMKLSELGKTMVEVLGNSTQSSVNRTESGCDPVYPTQSGVPMGLAENCLVTFQQITTYDSDGCPITSVYQYVSHTCPGDGSGSGEESGSGSGSGSGTGGDDISPPYGGGGGEVEHLADPEFDWELVLDDEEYEDPDEDTEYQEYQDGPWASKDKVIKTSDFVKYRKENGVGVNCLQLAKEQIGKNGYTCSGWLPGSQTFQLINSNGTVNSAVTKTAITYLHSALAQNIPVVIGVDAFNGSSNLDGVTDHFVVIVGSGTDPVAGKYFSFYDSSTDNASKGTSPYNRLYYNAITGKLSGPTQTGYTNQPQNVGHNYIITQVRKSVPKP